jgi:hypothetical protein
MNAAPDLSAARASRWATAALISFIYALVALSALHVLRPDYAPATNFISNYAVGPFGWVMTSFFVTFSLGLAAMVLAVRSSGPQPPLKAIGLVAVSITAVGLLVTAIYPTDLPGAPFTRSGEIHELSFRVNVVGLLVGVVALSLALGREPPWRPSQRTLGVLALNVVVALVLQFATLRKGMPYGLANRYFVIAIFAWLLFVTRQLTTRRGSAVR